MDENIHFVAKKKICKRKYKEMWGAAVLAVEAYRGMTAARAAVGSVWRYYERWRNMRFCRRCMLYYHAADEYMHEVHLRAVL